ncbi:MAG: hypothetical protein IPK07_06290 [Deltaproteobacteria bacterium]|nr:hypothetical protein [Deltaproteobacteria bacterium]
MSPPREPTPAAGASPVLRLVRGGRDAPGTPLPRAASRAGLRLVACPRREHTSPFDHYLHAPNRSHTPSWILAGAFAGWLVLGWTLLFGVVEPIGRGVVHEGTQSLFLAVAQSLPIH